MPIRSYAVKTDFDRDYSSPYWTVEDPPGSQQYVQQVIPAVDGGYVMQGYGNRDFGLRMGMNTARKYIDELQLLPTNKLLIIGAGFGWSIEYLESIGYTSVVGTDISPYIHQAKILSEDVDSQLAQAADASQAQAVKRPIPGPRTRTTRGILNEDGTTKRSQNQILGSMGIQKFDIGISEYVLDGLADSEAQSLSTMMRTLCTRVIHLVVAIQDHNPEDPNWNKKTLSQWRSLLFDDFSDTRGNRL